MSRNHNLLNRVTKMIDKKNSRIGAGLSFTIILDDEVTTIRTRGYQPNDQHNKHNSIQTEEGTTND